MEAAPPPSPPTQLFTPPRVHQPPAFHSHTSPLSSPRWVRTETEMEVFLLACYGHMKMKCIASILFLGVKSAFFSYTSGTDNPVGPTQSWHHHPQPLPLALLSQSEGRMEAGLLSSLQRTSSIQGLLGQQLSSSQLSFSSSVAPPPLPGPERFCPASLLESSGHRMGQRAGLGPGSGLHYESHFSKWSFSGRKGFNGPASTEGEGAPLQTIRTQVRRLSIVVQFFKKIQKYRYSRSVSTL